MKYTVIGTGAIGGYYGAMLQKGGIEVDFLARSDFGHIKEHGLRIDSVGGDFLLDKVNVYSSNTELPDTDVIIVSLKTTSNKDLKNIISPAVKENTVILVMQNGLGMEEEISEIFPLARVIGCMCFICSQKHGDGHIVHLDKGSVNFAPLNEEDMPIVEKLQSDFLKAGIEASSSSDLRTSRWSKLLWNIPYNGLSVVLNSNTREIMNSSYGTSLARRLMEEVVRGAEACGCSLPEESIERSLHFTKIMTPYDPSMKLDFDNKRQMEVEYIYRRPMEEAKNNGVELHLIKMLADQLSFINEQFELE